MVCFLQLSIVFHFRKFVIKQIDEQPVATAESHRALRYVNLCQLNVSDVIFLHYHLQCGLTAHHILVVASGNAEQSLFHGAEHHLLGFDKVFRSHYFRTVVAFLEYYNIVGFQLLEAFYWRLALCVCNLNLVSRQLCLGVIHSRDVVCGGSDDQVCHITVESLVGFRS